MRAHSMIENVRWIKGSLVLLTFAMVPIFAVNTASAHKAVIFAWVEGDTIYTESKLSGGKKVKKGDVIVYDLQGNRILEGKTNEDGEFSFKIPKKTALKIVLLAGMGHRGEWTLTEEEMTGGDTAKNTEVTLRQLASNEPQKQAPAISSSGLTLGEIQSAVEKALDKRLQPVIRMLVESQEKAPSFKDVLGGIGYIFGLAGVASYFCYRRKRSDQDYS